MSIQAKKQKKTKAFTTCDKEINIYRNKIHWSFYVDKDIKVHRY